MIVGKQAPALGRDLQFAILDALKIPRDEVYSIALKCNCTQIASVQIKRFITADEAREIGKLFAEQGEQ